MIRKQTIRQLRRAADLTQQQLADRAGLDGVTISRYERGLVTPSGPALQRIAEALGVDANEIDLDPQDSKASDGLHKPEAASA